MLRREIADDYVIASGEAHSISSFLECAFRHMGISDWEHYVRTDRRFMRDVDATILYGNPEKAKRLLGWAPKTTFDQLVTLMVDAAIERLSSSSANLD